jgi:hypothetical protein
MTQAFWGMLLTATHTRPSSPISPSSKLVTMPMPLPMPLLSRRRSRMFRTGARTCGRVLRTCAGCRMLCGTSRRRRHRNPQQRILCILRIINPTLHIRNRIIRIPKPQLTILYACVCSGGGGKYHIMIPPKLVCHWTSDTIV